jgi:hypothetical protein
VSDFSETNVNTEDTKKKPAPRLEKLVAAYATAASAAAGAVLLSAQGAEAKIVYTQTTTTINSTYALDLNHDGVTDFDIEFCDCLPHGFILQVGLGVPGNLVLDQAPLTGEAAALLRGAAIGPKQAFTANTSGYGGVFMALDSAYGTNSFSNGPWVGVKNRFLGLKFLINGEVHYGWARLTVAKHVDRVVLTGYAYETIANKSLQAGQTTEASADEATNATLLAAPLREGPSLGMLARGADALDVWRRRDPISTMA